MDGIYLKHMFISTIPLWWYLIFMLAIDILLTAIDIYSLVSAVKSYIYNDNASK